MAINLANLIIIIIFTVEFHVLAFLEKPSNCYGGVFLLVLSSTRKELQEL